MCVVTVYDHSSFVPGGEWGTEGGSKTGTYKMVLWGVVLEVVEVKEYNFTVILIVKNVLTNKLCPDNDLLLLFMINILKNTNI